MTTNRPYVLWRRVSTKQQGESGLGLEAQQAIAEYFMHGKPVRTFSDVYSGTKLASCPNLRRAIKFCKENDYLLVIAKTDRFRNVQDALAILDEMGEGNLCFCDLPTTDRTVLTIVFAIWERQATMGRINTKRALSERKKQQERDGQWISKAGNICTHLGNAKGCDMSAAHLASAESRTNAKINWLAKSAAVRYVRRKKSEGWTGKQITEELGKLYDENPEIYGTPTGCKPSAGQVSRWLRESNPILVG